MTGSLPGAFDEAQTLVEIYFEDDEVAEVFAMLATTRANLITALDEARRWVGLDGTVPESVSKQIEKARADAVPYVGLARNGLKERLRPFALLKNV